MYSTYLLVSSDHHNQLIFIESLTYCLYNPSCHQPRNHEKLPDEPTKTHIALFLGAGNAGKLFYINDQQAAPYAKLCKPDIPIQAVGCKS